VKETPSVIILDKGKPVVEKNKPKRKLIVIFAMLLGGMFSLGVTLLKRTIDY